MNADERKATVERLFLQEWSQTRQKGRRRHAWIMAVAFGIVFGASRAIFDIIRGRFDGTDLLIDLAFTVFGVGGGYFVGVKSWIYHEDRFRAISQRVNAPATSPDA